MNVLDQVVTDRYALYHGDSCEVLKGLPDGSVHLSIYSPPFSQLYVYSDSANDLGNSADDSEFFEHYNFLIRELHRVTVPGRLSAVHCKQLVNYKGRDGMAGLRDFRGEIIRRHVEAGWAFHSEVTIWKDPVIEMQRTKAHGLLHKQVCADSSFSRQGMAEYLLMFRRWPRDEFEDGQIEPVTRPDIGPIRFSDYIGESGPPTVRPHGDWHTLNGEAQRKQRAYSIEVWQRYASPVWMDIRQTNVLNVQAARADEDSKHICPLQLDVIERAVELWTNPGDVVLDPFDGIGSSASTAVKMGRRAIGVELKHEYHEQALVNVGNALASTTQATLFDGIAV